nr:MAG TPA: hypothetical protein [Caudoviricetes sp.]
MQLRQWLLWVRSSIQSLLHQFKILLSKLFILIK